MVYDLANESIAISGAVCRGLNDLVSQVTNNLVSAWKNGYSISLDLDGRVRAEPQKNNGRGLCGFSTTLDKKLVALPTPVWVYGCKQKIFICFAYEVPEMMQEWWKTHLSFNA